MDYEKDCQEKTDEELARLSGEDQGYFFCLVKRYEHSLFRYIRRISSFSYEEAEDILQEAFIKVYQNINDFDQDLKFSSWLYRIVHNQTVSSFRKKKARAEGQLIDLSEEVFNNFASELDVAKELDLKFNKELISRVLGGIDRKYREVLVLKFFEEKDYKEISDIIKKPIGTVGTLINRGKEKLKEEIVKRNINID